MAVKQKLVLIGIDGYSKDASFEIGEGSPKVIGRSRSCDCSLRRLKSWMEAPEEERDKAEEFKTVSRRHLKVELFRDPAGRPVVKLADLSRNGTFVDEERIGAVHEIKEWGEPHYLRLGEKEKYKLSLADDTGAPAPAAPAPGPDDGGGRDPETDSHKNA
ncbi:MAG: FHA domain-containing protein [Planctomycetota bacterium]